MQAVHSLANYIAPTSTSPASDPSYAKKVIVVFTATGDQGRSTCRSLLQDGGYEVVGITRNLDSENAKRMSMSPLSPHLGLGREK